MLIKHLYSNGSGGGRASGPCPTPGPVKISYKKDKMAAEGGRIEFMFLMFLMPPTWPLNALLL